MSISATNPESPTILALRSLASDDNSPNPWAQALLAEFSDLRRKLGASEAIVERQRATIEKAKKDSANAHQAIVEADNVKHNVGLRIRSAHKARSEAEALLEKALRGMYGSLTADDASHLRADVEKYFETYSTFFATER